MPPAGVSALGCAIREAWVLDPALLARVPTFPPRHALEVYERLGSRDTAAAQRFGETHRESIETATRQRVAALAETEDRRGALAADAHALRQRLAEARERARVADIHARAAFTMLAR